MRQEKVVAMTEAGEDNDFGVAQRPEPNRVRLRGRSPREGQLQLFARLPRQCAAVVAAAAADAKAAPGRPADWPPASPPAHGVANSAYSSQSLGLNFAAKCSNFT